MRRTFAASQERKTPYYITARLVPTRELVPGRLCVTAGSPNLSGNSLINRGSKMCQRVRAEIARFYPCALFPLQRCQLLRNLRQR
jgi:hypothetical protein